MTQSAPQKTPEKLPVSEGKKAPEFTLRNQNDKVVKLSSYKGKQTLVLAFFPKAFTGG